MSEQRDELIRNNTLGQLADEVLRLGAMLAEREGSLSESVDMANVGRAFMEKLPKDYSWCECPTEYVTRLTDQRDESTDYAGQTLALLEKVRYDINTYGEVMSGTKNDIDAALVQSGHEIVHPQSSDPAGGSPVPANAETSAPVGEGRHAVGNLHELIHEVRLHYDCMADGGFVRCMTCGSQEETRDMDIMRPLGELLAALDGCHSQGIVREMCDVCEASDYVHRSVPALANLIEATADTLSSHKEITECCSVTRQRVEEAKALLREFRKLPDYLETSGCPAQGQRNGA